MGRRCRCGGARVIARAQVWLEARRRAALARDWQRAVDQVTAEWRAQRRLTSTTPAFDEVTAAARWPKIPVYQDARDAMRVHMDALAAPLGGAR